MSPAPLPGSAALPPLRLQVDDTYYLGASVDERDRSYASALAVRPSHDISHRTRFSSRSVDTSGGHAATPSSRLGASAHGAQGGQGEAREAAAAVNGGVSLGASSHPGSVTPLAGPGIGAADVEMGASGVAAGGVGGGMEDERAPLTGGLPPSSGRP